MWQSGDIGTLVECQQAAAEHVADRAHATAGAPTDATIETADNAEVPLQTAGQLRIK